MTTGRDPVVVGVATTTQSVGSGRTGVSLALEALRAALTGCGLAVADVQGVYARGDGWPTVQPGNTHHDHINWARQLGIPMRWATGAANAAGTGAPALLDAAAAIRAGYIDTAAIIVGQAPTSVQRETLPGYARAAYEFTSWTGSFTAVQFALLADRHRHEYGTSAEQLARASATIRNHGRLNPNALAYGRAPLSAADVLAAPMVAEPLTRLMCAQVADGGAALIVTTAERAADLPVVPVAVLGGADQVCYPAYAEAPLLRQPSGESFPADWVAAGFANAGVERSDVDVVELYDAFAPWVVLQWELLGFCAEGEGGAFVDTGVMAVDGALPTGTDGGCLAFGDNGAPSLYRIVEAVRQLRGDVPDGCPAWARGEHTYRPDRCRAARDPRVALAVSMGPPTGGGSFVLLARS
jgi:acetyl-CoA acetyltransferase